MSLPTNFFIGRGGGLVLLEILMTTELRLEIYKASTNVFKWR